MCSDKVAKECKAKGDWCEKHDRAMSQCFICNPTGASSTPPSTGPSRQGAAADRRPGRKEKTRKRPVDSATLRQIQVLEFVPTGRDNKAQGRPSRAHPG